MKPLKLDKEEKELLASIERGEWRSVKNLKKELARHRQIARNTLKKNKRVNIRISSMDLLQLQFLASREGIPYQTLMGSVLHKFAAGLLADKGRKGYGEA